MVTTDEIKLSPSSFKLPSDSEDETVGAEKGESTKPADETTEAVDKEEDPVVQPAKSKGKRPRQTNETRGKLAEKPTKTDNKLKKILDEWSDDEMAEAATSAATSNKTCVVVDTDDEEDAKVKKKLKFDNERTSDPNGTADDESVDRSPKTITEPVESAPKNAKDETIVERQSNDATTDDAKLQPRFSLRSGRTMLENATPSPITPKRRGRAKRTVNEALKCEAVTEDIKPSVVEPLLHEKTETTETVTVAAGDKVAEESVPTVAVPAKGTNKRRKGKPRRKEEIKLANNVSVAVLVEKTNSSPTADQGGEPKTDLPGDDTEYTNVVHQKISYSLGHSSTDDHTKSAEPTEPMDEPQLPEPDQQSNNHTDDDRMVVGDVESGNNTGNDVDVAKEMTHSNDQNEENNVLDVSVAEHTDSNATTFVDESTEKMNENSSVNEPVNDDRATQKCYKRKAIPKTKSSDQPAVSTASVTASFTDDSGIDTYESPSSSNLRQRAPKRYENTRNRRKSERRTISGDDFTAIVREIDENCDEIDDTRPKSVDLTNSFNEDMPKLSDPLDDSGKEGTDSTNNLFDQSSENSNSKTSTPEKADNSKELDCFDFTEDECQPQVLNRRKRLPPVKVFELDDMDKIEEQRKLDEEAALIAQQREDEHKKLHAELENLLNSTTPVQLPEIPIGPKVQENFPERRAEKDPEKTTTTAKESDIKERMLPPKERNKRIFKYRNRNRRPDSDATTTRVSSSCDVEESKDNNSVQQQEVHCDDNVVVTSGNEMEMVTSVDAMEVVTSVDEMEVVESVDTIEIVTSMDAMEVVTSVDTMEVVTSVEEMEVVTTSVCETEVGPKLESNNQVLAADPSAHDLKIEIAETLINFPLLSPHADGNEQSLGKAVTKSPITAKESVKRTKANKKLRSAATVNSSSKILPDVCRQETIVLPTESSELSINATKDTSSHTTQQPAANLPIYSNDSVLHSTPNEQPMSQLSITKTETVTANATTKPSTSSSARDFSRIRLIEKIDNQTPPIQSTDESAATHQLPLKKTVIFTQTEGNSFIPRIPKKRKSQTDDDIPAFVIERPKDHADDASESNSQQMVTKKEPKSFVVTKTVKKQLTGDLAKRSAMNVGGAGAHPNEVNDSQHESKTMTGAIAGQSVPSSIKKVAQIVAASEISAIESPVIMNSHLIVQKSSPATNAQKRTASTAAAANVLGSLSANRPCTIAPAKKASYRRPTDMTGLTQKQIGIDGKGNPVMIYTKITPVVTQTPPIISQATFGMKRNEPIASTSQSVQSMSPAVQSNQGNQFVITSKGALITNKPFITTTPSSTQFHHPTLTHRPNVHVHTQIIRSPNPPAFQQHPQSPQSSQILIQTKPTNSLAHVSSLAPVKKPATSVVRRNVAKTNVNDDNNAAVKKRIVRRTSKNQSPATVTQQQQQVIINSDINHIGNAATPVPPLIPINDQSSVVARKQLSAKQPPPQMTFVPEPPKTTHVDVVEQNQEILALPGDTPGFGGPPGSYFLCKLNEMGVYVPIDRQPLYLDVTDNTNLLKPNAPDGVMEMQTVAINETECAQQVSFVLHE